MHFGLVSWKNTASVVFFLIRQSPKFVHWLNFNTMAIFLIVVIALLIGIIIYLNFEFYKEKKHFQAKIETMQQFIIEITQKQSGQNNQVKLSDELNEKLKTSNAVLSHDIFGLNYELFDMLSKNNLLKK